MNTEPCTQTGQMVELWCEYLSVWGIDWVFLSCHIRVASESALWDWLNVVMGLYGCCYGLAKWLWIRVLLQSLNFQLSSHFRVRSSLTSSISQNVDSLQTRSSLTSSISQNVDSLQTRMWHGKNTQSMLHTDKYSQHSSTI